MDSLIIQVGNRQGRLAEFIESSDQSIKIGRSFVNNVVLADPYVAPEQAVIEWKGDAWSLKVLDQTNPVLVNGEPLPDGESIIESGDRITLGRTQIHVYSKNHKFDAARKLLFSGWFYHNKLAPYIPVVVLIVATFIALLDQYLATSDEFSYRPYLSRALVFILSASVWAAFWALIGRLLRHQLHFYMNLLFTSMMLIFFMIFSPIGEYVEFVSGSINMAILYELAVFLVFSGLLLRFNLSLSTNLKNTGKTGFSMSCIFILLSYLGSVYTEDEFSSYAEYSDKLKPPFSKIVADVTLNEYLISYQELFNEVERLAKEE